MHSTFSPLMNVKISSSFLNESQTKIASKVLSNLDVEI